MIKIAITGNIASGKSLIESFFRKEGFITADTDKMTHNILANNQTIIQKICNIFGSEIKNEQGYIDRKKLGNIVFNDKNKLKQLENIIHPEIKIEMQECFNLHKNESLVAICVPQLYEAGMENFFDYVILITANDEIRIKRLLQRNNLTEKEALIRIKAQMPQEEKKAKADFIIENNGNIEETELLFKNILTKLKSVS